MCDCLNKNICSATNTKCPYVYFCDKLLTYRPSKSMPKVCKVAQKFKEKSENEGGLFKVEFVRHGQLYIKYFDKTIVIPNPFPSEIPKYVKLKEVDGRFTIE